MPLYVVTFEHSDEIAWKRHFDAHIRYLQALLEDGTLRASGPFPGDAQRKVMLILKAENRAALDALIAADPLAVENLIENITVAQWDPIFGAFSADSSHPGHLPGR